MRAEELKALLEKCGADGWELTDTVEEGWEFYLIRHQLDQNRVRVVEHQSVKVYRRSEDGQFLGSASGEIPPTATETEAKAAIAGFLQAAGYVRNPAYTLRKPQGGPERKWTEVKLPEIAGDFLQTIAQVPETATEDLNSVEVFVTDRQTRFLSSEGVDVTSRAPVSMVEAVVNARHEGSEIELYRMYHCGTCDREGLTRDLTETMTFGRDKLIAGKTPALGEADVVFSTDAACEIYRWFISRTDARMKVYGFSDWEPGKPIAENITGDRITLQAVEALPNSSANAAFDAEGAPVRNLVILQEDVPVAWHGSRQFSQYLGLEDAFIPGNYKVCCPDAAPAETLRTGRFLEVVEFSDFQVDALNGDIAGEIRLAYWHDGDSVTPVSGGSVSGTMADFVKTMRVSAEQRQYNSLLIPAVTRLHGVHIAGA